MAFGNTLDCTVASCPFCKKAHSEYYSFCARCWLPIWQGVFIAANQGYWLEFRNPKASRFKGPTGLTGRRKKRFRYCLGCGSGISIPDPGSGVPGYCQPKRLFLALKTMIRALIQGSEKHRIPNPLLLIVPKKPCVLNMCSGSVPYLLVPAAV